MAEAPLDDRILYTSLGGPAEQAPIVVSGGVYLPKK